MTIKINEFASIPMGKLEPAGSYAGATFYTSDKLKQKFIVGMMKSGRGAPIVNKVKELVNNNTIIPVYKTKSIWRSILKMQPIELAGLAGAALPDKKLVYIFVEEDANLFSFVSSDALAKVTIHELLHLLSFTKPKIFFNIFKNDLKEFYNFYFCRLLNCNEDYVNQRNLNDLINFFYFKIEGRNSFLFDKKLNETYTKKIINTYRDISTLDHSKFMNLLFEYFSLIGIIQRFEVFGQSHKIESMIMAKKHIISPFYAAYKTIFSIFPEKENQLVYQEMFAPSEVISTLSISTTLSNNIITGLNKL